MLNRWIKRIGLALIIGLTVPGAHQAHSSYEPSAALFSGLQLELTTDGLSSLLSQVAPVPLAQSASVLPADVNLLGSTLAIAPQAQDVRLEIHLQRREVLIYQGESLVKRYPVGIGRAGWETPVGTFEVRQMRENPTWISPFNGQRIPSGDARNPLGTRWIGFWTDGNNWIGFHGTRNPATVGRNSSHGCLHMHRADLEDLYRRVQLGTLVTVRP